MSTTLEKAKCEQACELLKELDLDSWLVWVRETSQMADPVLELVLGGDLVWQSALLFTKSGEKLSIVGSFDAPDGRGTVSPSRVPLRRVMSSPWNSMLQPRTMVK